MPKNKRVDDRKEQDKASTKDRKDTECPEKLEPHHEGHIPKEGLKKIKKSQGVA